MNRFNYKQKIKGKFNKSPWFLKKKPKLKLIKNNKTNKDNKYLRLKFKSLNKKSPWYLSWVKRLKKLMNKKISIKQKRKIKTKRRIKYLKI